MVKKVDFESSKTKENLARSFGGECQDGARYQFLAKQAENEGYENIKIICKTFAKNEMAHAERFFNLISENTGGKEENIEIKAGYPFVSNELKTTIKDAIETELSQSKNIYPQFAKVAIDEGYNEIAEAFTLTASVENSHQEQLKELLEKLNKGNLYKSPTSSVWKCTKCGYKKAGKTAWSKCPSCTAPQGFVDIDLSSFAKVIK